MLRKLTHILTITGLRRAKTLLPLLLTLIALPSCHQSGIDEPDADPLMVNLTLSVGVNGDVSATRAVDDNNYFEGPSTIYEKMNSLRIIIVRPSGVVEHNRLLKFDKNGVVIADNQLFKVIGNEAKKVYLIANENSVPTYDFSSISVEDQFPAEEIENLIVRRAARVPLYDNTVQSGAQYLPMSECFDITVTTEPYQSSTMFITRAASKFSFSIKKTSDYEGAATLTAIRISGIGDAEYLMPKSTVYNPMKYQPSDNPLQGRYITAYETPTQDASDFDFEMPSPLNLKNLNSTYNWVPELYLPESPVSESGYYCTLIFDDGKLLTNPVKLPNLSSLPRNSHVKVNITIGNEHTMLLEVEALPWDYESTEFDFTDHVGLTSNGVLTFSSGSYFSLDRTSARMVLNTYPTPAVGSFGIATPMGARWDAYLISSPLGAIQFVTDMSGSEYTYSDHISGDVGKLVNFRIGAASAAGDEARTAILQVIVTLPDGTALPANVIQGWNSSEDFLTIIQNPK